MDRRDALTAILALPAGSSLFTTEPATGTPMTVTPLKVQSFDLIVLTAPGFISQETAERLKHYMDALIPAGVENVRCVVLGDGLSVSVIRQGPLDA
jgi:hypothetical protein